jgi:hypothetical protein
MHCYEQPNSREIKGDPITEAVLHYVVHGTDDDATAQGFLFTAASLTFRGLDLDKTAIQASTEGGGIWRFNLPYKKPSLSSDSPSGGGGADAAFGKLDFDISGQTQHVTQCIEQSEFGPTAAPDVRTARVVGLTRDGVDGVDIDVGKQVLVWHARFEPDEIDGAKIERWGRAYGKTNSAAFPLGNGFYDTGELRFLGVSGSSHGKDHWDVTFRFEFSPNVGPIVISPTVNVPIKRGHEYLWVQYHKDVKVNEFIEVPLRAWVSKMFEECNFLTEIGVLI